MLLFKSDTTIADFLKNYGNSIQTTTGEWYYSPFWFTETKDGLVGVNFENLPTELLDEIKKRRDGKGI